MVPTAEEPPISPSTDQVTVPPLAVNCCVPENNSTEDLGVTENPTPVPEIGTVCGVPGALSLMVTVEFRTPVVNGVKITLMVHDAPAESIDPQLFVWLKSPELPPLMLMLLID